MTKPSQSSGQTSLRGPLLRRSVPSIAVSAVVPVVIYEAIRSSVDSDVTALAIGAAAPVAWTLGSLLVRRKLDLIGLVSTGIVGVGLLVAWLSGGNPLALELRDVVPTGLIGLACVVSVLIRRPLHAVVFRLLGKRDVAVRTSNVVTSVLGGTFLVHAAALTVLALSTVTSTYVALSQPIGWGIIAAGVALVLWYRHRMAAGSGPADIPQTTERG
jgi:hypothetical protein